MDTSPMRKAAHCDRHLRRLLLCTRSGASWRVLQLADGEREGAIRDMLASMAELAYSFEARSVVLVSHRMQCL